MRRLAIAALLAGASLFAAAPVRADASDDAAKARFAEGTKLYNKHDYEKARVAFLQAAALKKKPAITFMLAECSLKLGRWLDAAKGFDQYTSEAGDVPPKLRNRLEADKKEARAHIAHLRFDVPDGAEVVIDGERVDSVASPVDVIAGPHAIVITHKDEKKAVNVDAEAGKVTDVHPTFVPKALTPTAETRKEPTPPPPPKPEESPSILAPPQTKWPIYVSGAIGVGGLMSAAIFGGIASNARHGIDVSNSTIARNANAGADCSNPSSFDNPSKGQSADTFANACHTIARSKTIADVDGGIFQASLVVGIVGMVGAITWFFVAPKEGEDTHEQTTQLVPWMGPEGAGATFSGRF